MTNSLVIVESPAKARTIERYLGPGYRVESSIGHIRDLPRTAAEVPEKYRGRPWARLGVDIEGGFDPLYVIPREKKEQITKLRKALRDADELVLATDEDREGEAIAWHLKEVLRPKVPVRRMVFHEITRSAVEAALTRTRDIDHRLVDAQEARRVLDRLYGYEVSPVLWKKVQPRLSAGRVQSVATRIVVERERERMAFVPADYWTVDVELETEDGQARRFPARVSAVGGRTVARGRDFDRTTGKLKTKAHLLLQVEAETLGEELPSTRPVVAEVKEQPFTRRPYAPFITSTLQQEAARKLRYTAQRTMRVAQGLYENGYITYMRTDSTSLSGQAIAAARRQVADLYGSEYLPAKARVYARRANAQEAHEAIRPAGTSFRTPDQLRGALDRDSLRLYELIWKRTLASQMKDATGTSTTVLLETSTPGTGAVQLTASGRVLRFAGFLRVYVEGSDDPRTRAEDEERFLPPLRRGETVGVATAEPNGHTTQAPARYTEASLVRELEKQGVGRPSTYAAILQTIVDRGYVWKKGSALVPTFLAFAVTRLLEQHLGDLVDLDFTARMESDLDAIAGGEREARPWLRNFYFGREPGPDSAGRKGLQSLVGEGIDDIDARAVCSLLLGEDEEGRAVAVRVGRYGPYVQAGDDGERVSLEESTPPDELTLERALSMLESVSEQSGPLGHHPETGEPVYVKTGRYGDYVQLGDAVPSGAGRKRGRKSGGGAAKPKMASLWPSMDRKNLTLDEALLLLSFPRELGRHPESDEVITVQDGRYGAYIRCGKESRSLESQEQMATIGVDDALALLRQPKRRRGSASVLKELGEHPKSGLALSIKTGRFGPYVTDGQVNATVPKARDPQDVGLEEAVDLLAAREAKLVAQGKDPRAPRRRPVRKRRSTKKTSRR
ncbi:MAG: type I DNA topoisomerase [Acidobacteriota bacterium]|nr:type I DNA topoisomerase [Acidobacteriota bacterium]MDE3263750.1 type I DNA topoisomerase [Acidobacteriota bacterium]